MKRTILAAVAAICLISSAAYAGYGLSSDIHGETEAVASDLDSLMVFPVYNLDADDDGTEDNTDTDSNGEVVYFNAAVLGGFEELTAASTLTTAECGKTFTLNSATEFAVTLPAPTANCRFKFVITGVPAGANYTVVTASSANIMVGGINELEVDTGDDGPFDADGDTISFVSASSGVTPQAIGDWVEMWSDGTYWHIDGQSQIDGGVTITQAS